MDNKNKQRISLYLDKKLVRRVDKIIDEYGFKSRNSFYANALENYIADEILLENKNILSDKLVRSLSDVAEENSKAMSKGLFRYAVQLEMLMRMLAEQFDYDEEEIKEFRREAINNVRRTRGKVKLEDIAAGYYNNDDE